MTTSDPSPHLIAEPTRVASKAYSAIGARAPWRAEVIGLGLALLMAGALIALLRSSMDTARQRRLGVEAAQRVLIACESLPLASERRDCRQAPREPSASLGAQQQGLAAP